MQDDEAISIPSVLACDVGNSAIHFAWVQGETVSTVQTFRLGELAGLGAALAELWQQMPAPKVFAAASVNPVGLRALEAAAAETLPAQVRAPGKPDHEPLLVVGRELPLPIETNLPEPDRIGTDRLCAAVAAYDRLGGACVVADFGTAITIDCVNETGMFLGGAILPGLSLGSEMLGTKTAQLPQVKLSEPTWTYGRNTEEAIVGGLLIGARGALREFVERYATDLGRWPTVIITGGDAEWICPNVQDSGLVQAIVPDLTIRGVAAAYYKTLVK